MNWTIERKMYRNMSEQGFTIDGFNMPVHGDNGELIATVQGDTMDELQQRAQLIAKAPQMLELLKVIAASSPDGNPFSNIRLAQALINDINL